MYVSVRDYEGNNELVDALVENESEVRRIISEIEGFEAYYLIRTTEGTAVSVSVFDAESSAQESNQVAANWIKENLSDMSVSPPKVSAGEVALTF